MTSQAPKAVLIAGPTASGKSALATALAEAVGGVVVNADSMQVYADLRILTARPTPQDEARVPHALYGVVPGSEAYSAGRFVADAAKALEAAREAGRVPLVVGGTGLYFKALLEGLSPIPAIPGDVRDHWRRLAATRTPQELHATLATRDPAMAARLDAGDPQRIVRALEVLDATGVSLADWWERRGVPVLRPEETLRLVVELPRDELRRRCDARFDVMLQAGALDEAATLRARGLDPGLPIMRCLGVRPLMRHLDGEIDLAAATELAKAETRQYVKRQVTWVRTSMISWKRVLAEHMKSSGDHLLRDVSSALTAP